MRRIDDFIIIGVLLFLAVVSFCVVFLPEKTRYKWRNTIDYIFGVLSRIIVTTFRS